MVFRFNCIISHVRNSLVYNCIGIVLRNTVRFLFYLASVTCDICIYVYLLVFELIDVQFILRIDKNLDKGLILHVMKFPVIYCICNPVGYIDNLRGSRLYVLLSFRLQDST